MGPVEGTNIATNTDSARDSLTQIISQITELEKTAVPPYVQEFVLARRAAEDCRMRLGVGLAYIKGANPWINKVEAK